MVNLPFLYGTNMKTKHVKKEEITRSWHLIDAKGKILGRLATQIAVLLRGKHKVNFSLQADLGDGVVVVNCEKIKVTGKKEDEKMYKNFSGYPGGLRLESLGSLRKRRPNEIIRHAVWGMLPKNKIGRKMIKRLKVYKGDKHPHISQSPKEEK